MSGTDPQPESTLQNGSADSRTREVELRQKRVSEINARLKTIEKERDRLALPLRTRAERRLFDRLREKHDKLLGEYQEHNRHLAELALPPSVRVPEDPPTLFDSHLLLPFEHPGTKIRLAHLFNNPQETGRFLRNSLLYDRIFIPTVDLLVLMLLVTMIGPENLIQSLDNGEVTLVRFRGALGYVGNGNGLSMFQLLSNQEGRIEQEHDRTWAPTEDVLTSLGQQFASGQDNALHDYWPEISRHVLAHIWEIDSQEFNVVEEATYRDVLGNPLLLALLDARRGNLKQLPGVGPDGVRWLDSKRLNDDVDTLLHIAQFDFESYLADKVGALDLTSGPGVQTLLSARASQRFGAIHSQEALGRILNLARVPDFSSLHEDDDAVNRLWKLRRSREADEFRRWFHENVRTKPQEAEALFYETLGKPSLGANPIFRAIRYLAFSLTPALLGTGAEGIALGLGASAADSFLVDRFLKPSGPKVMIDRLGAILPSLKSKAG